MTFIFFTKTLFMILGRAANGQGVNYAYQGVQPIDGVPEEDHIRHAYYQWVPFVLALQGFLFCMFLFTFICLHSFVYIHLFTFICLQ